MKLNTVVISLAALAATASQASAVVLSNASLDWSKLSIIVVGDSTPLIDPAIDQSTILEFAQILTSGTVNSEQFNRNQSTFSSVDGQASATIKSTLDVSNPSDAVQNSSANVSAAGLQLNSSTAFRLGTSRTEDGILLAPGATVSISVPYQISCKIDAIAVGFASSCLSQVALDASIFDPSPLFGPNIGIDEKLLIEEIKLATVGLQEKSGLASFTLTNSSTNANFLRFSLGTSTSASLSAVPVPAALPLLATGLGVIP